MRRITVWIDPTEKIERADGEMNGADWVQMELERLGDNHFDRRREDGFLSIWTNRKGDV